jgi:hypothetical protein
MVWTFFKDEKRRRNSFLAVDNNIFSLIVILLKLRSHSKSSLERWTLDPLECQLEEIAAIVMHNLKYRSFEDFYIKFRTSQTGSDFFFLLFLSIQTAFIVKKLSDFLLYVHTVKCQFERNPLKRQVMCV